MRCKFWELAHAVTMLPGLFLPMRAGTAPYKAFCVCSFTYHMCKSLFKHKKTHTLLLRADLLSQLLACVMNNKRSNAYIYAVICASPFINVNDLRQKRIHLVLNGTCILYVNRLRRGPALLGWTSVIFCSLIANITDKQFYHSLMHLLGHLAFYAQQHE